MTHTDNIFVRFASQVFAKLQNITDFLIFDQRVSLSEGILFGVLFIWTLWYSVFDARFGNHYGDNLYSGWVLAVCVVTTCIHFLSFFRSAHVRMSAIALQGMLWAVLAALIAFHDLASPVWPTFALFTLASVIIWARLQRDVECR